MTTGQGKEQAGVGSTIGSAIGPDVGPNVGPRGMARRQALLEAARHLFVEKGFEKTTLSDIINRAGGSRATLYDQFGDKDGLFRVMLEENSARILEGMMAAQAVEDVPPEVALTGFARHFVHALLDAPTIAIVRILVSEGGRVPDIAETFFHVGPDRADAHLADYLESQCDSGVLRIEDPHAAARAFMGMVTGSIVIRRLIRPQDPIDLEAADHDIRQAVALFLSGALVIKE